MDTREANGKAVIRIARVVELTKAGPIVRDLTKTLHSELCWCRPVEQVEAARRKEAR